MKSNLTLPVLFFLLLSMSAYCQPDSTKLLHKTFKVTLKNMNNQVQMGFLADMNDSSLFVSNSPVQFGRSALTNKSIRNVSAPDISYLKIRRKGSTGRGILYGAVAGGLTGIVSGYLSGDDPETTYGRPTWFRMTASEKAAGLGILGALGGGFVGGIVGALAHKEFTIGGKKENFDAMRATVIEKAYRK